MPVGQLSAVRHIKYEHILIMWIVLSLDQLYGAAL